MPSLEELFPPFALRVRAGSLELRMVRDEDIPPLVDLVLAGLHDPATMPFLTPWTDAPRDELGPLSAVYWWRARAEFGRASWSLNLVVREAGEVVGIQGLEAGDFAVTRSAESGSWLGRAHQGRGIGTRMRQAICALAFDHLGAVEVTSGVFEDNAASRAVGRRVGYLPNGERRIKRRDEAAVLLTTRVTPGTFVRGADDVHVEGIAPLRAMLGLE